MVKGKNSRKSVPKRRSPSRDVSRRDITSSSNSSNTTSSGSVVADNKICIEYGNYRVNYTVKQLGEMERLQKLNTLIPKLPFSRVLKEILQQYGEFRMTAEALVGLQEAAEMYLTHLYEDSNKCCLHAKRITLKPIDMQLVMALRQPFDKVGWP